ncbi:MAG: Fic family protein [Aureispira sp.]
MTITTLIQQLDKLKETLDSFRPIEEDRYRRIMQKLQLDWNYNSNSIEGNTLTLSETKQLLYYGLTAKGKPLNDHKEMEGHAQVLKQMEKMVHQDTRLTESLMKEFHALILVPDYDNSKEKDVEINPGHWKTTPNYLLTPTREKLEFLSPEAVPAAMNELINWVNNHLHQNTLNRHNKKKYQLHPLRVACGFHKRFIDIHPFGDGNGRMARILMNLILMQQGYMPAIVYLEQRQEYYSALNTSTFEDISPLASYIGQNLMQSMQLAIDGAQGKPVEEQKDWMKQLSVLERTLEDQKRRNEVTHWSIEQQEVVIHHFFTPFITGLYDASQKLTAIYDKVEWETSIRVLIPNIEHNILITGVKDLVADLQRWYNTIETIEKDKSYHNKELKILLEGVTPLSINVEITIQLSVKQEFYGIHYQLDGTETKLCSYTYDKVPDAKQIEQHVDAIMTAIVDYTKQQNNPNQ